MTDRLTSLEKGIEILRIIASRTDGCQMTGVVAESGIPRTSVLRLVAQMERAGLVDRSPDRRTLYLGPMLLRFGDLARQRHTLVDHAQTVLAWLSEQTGETSYLSMRHGLDAVCVARFDGSSFIRVVMLEVGTRRPLGLGAGSAVLLSGLDPLGLEEVLALNQQRAGTLPYDPECVRAMVRQVHEQGIASHCGQIVSGAAGLGVPVRNVLGEPEAAISLSFVSRQISAHEQLLHYRQCLQEAAARMERRLHNNFRSAEKKAIKLKH